MINYKNIIFRAWLTIGLILFASACAHQDPSKSRLVKENADLAVEKCGKGRVKQVSIEGYECK